MRNIGNKIKIQKKTKTYLGVRTGCRIFQPHIPSAFYHWNGGKSIPFSTNMLFGLMREHSLFLLLSILHTKANVSTPNDSPSLMILPAVAMQLKFLAKEYSSVCSNIYTLALLFNRCYSVS